MTTYQYLLKHPNSKKHQAYMQRTITQLRAYKPVKRSKINLVRALLVKYESVLERATLQGI